MHRCSCMAADFAVNCGLTVSYWDAGRSRTTGCRACVDDRMHAWSVAMCDPRARKKIEALPGSGFLLSQV